MFGFRLPAPTSVGRMTSRSRAAIAALALSLVGTAIAQAPAQALPGDASALTMALYGDVPYGRTPTDTAQLDRYHLLVDKINAADVSSVVHVGDLHSGKSYCTEAFDRRMQAELSRFTTSVVYTPGDNEWTDCHRPGEGGNAFVDGQPVDYANGNPVANLELIRSLFFANPGTTLGDGNLHVQAQEGFPEDVQWQRKGIQFVTLNIPGGSNNDTDPWYGAATASEEQRNEVASRTAADLTWLDTAFARASADGAKGVVVLTQADMWDLDGKDASHLSGYEPFVKSLADHTNAYGGPVMLFNGDSHVYRSENPFSATAPCETESGACTSVAATHPGYTVPNFHRVVVHGSTFPFEWLKLTIDPRGDGMFGPFSWSRQATGITAATPAS